MDVPGLVSVALGRRARLPLRLRCGAGYQGWTGDGWLTISKGEVTFEFSRLSWIYPVPRDIVRAITPVVLVKARLRPLGLNRALILPTAGPGVQVLLWFGVQHCVRASLRSAGIEVNEVRTWTALGRGMAWRREKTVHAPRAATVLGTVVALVFTALVAFYGFVQARNIPTFLPGRVNGSMDHQYRWAEVSALCAIVGWLSVLVSLSAKRRSRDD